MQSLVYIPLILCVAFGGHVSVTPPTPPVPKHQRKIDDFPIFMWKSIVVFKSICWVHAIIEIVLLVASALLEQFPDSVLANYINTTFVHQLLLRSTVDDSIYFTSLRLLGGAVVILCSATRYWCFQELGRHFTFHVSILKNHDLITTGPYSYVRHPSYTSGALINIGTTLWYGMPGSWLRESSFLQFKMGWVVVGMMVVFMCRAVVFSVARCSQEDEILKKEFGKKWNDWVEKVPYRLVPGLY